MLRGAVAGNSPTGPGRPEEPGFEPPTTTIANPWRILLLCKIACKCYKSSRSIPRGGAKQLTNQDLIHRGGGGGMWHDVVELTHLYHRHGGLCVTPPPRWMISSQHGLVEKWRLLVDLRQALGTFGMLLVEHLAKRPNQCYMAPMYPS